MPFHRFGAAALVFVLASGAHVMRAHACDDRIAGSCQGAPITHPSTAMEAGGDSAEPAQRVSRRSFGKRRSARFRHYRHRRHNYAASKRKPARTAVEIDPAESIRTGAKLKALRQTFAQNREPENVGVGASVWAGVDTSPPPPQVPTRLASPMPPPAPMPALKGPSDLGPSRGVKADMITPQPTLVRTSSIVPAKPATPTPTNSPPEGGQTTFDQAVQQTPPVQADLTVMRAMLLTFAGLLAVGTAVRLVL